MKKVKIHRSTLYLGDCRKLLKRLDDESISAIVSDVPYELKFMGRAWDSSGISYNVKMWKQSKKHKKAILAFAKHRKPLKRKKT